MRHTKGWKAFSLVALLTVTAALAGSCSAASYDSMRSYEDLLRSQTVLIGSFESLLKNTTLQGSGYNYHYQFLDSFDDLAKREQEGLASFEDLVSYNWSTLSEEEKIELTKSYEDLIRREAIILSSNEDLLKRGFCSLSPAQKQELLDRFESRLKYEVHLYRKFDEWLQFQQMIEGTQKQTWIGFLDSYEDLLRRQANLLSSFEMLLKIKCDGGYLTLTRSVLSQAGNDVVYQYRVTARNHTANITITDQLLGVIWTHPIVPAGFDQTFNVSVKGLSCGECDNCSCNLCGFATVCGEVVTANGNFTICSVSNQNCVIVNEYIGPAPHIIYPGIEIEEFAADQFAADQGAGAIVDQFAIEGDTNTMGNQMAVDGEEWNAPDYSTVAANSSPVEFGY